MVTLSFTLLPEALAALHDALACLSKFSESVSIEARRDRLSLTALNSSKSAYASFALEGPKFFSRYEFAPDAKNVDARFTCRIYNKALLSVFKGRVLDPRGKDTTVDRCEVSLQDRPDKAECRLIIKMLSSQGVTKTYKLTYESVEVMHALFDKQSAHCRWNIHSAALKDMIEYFGPKTEQLDIYAEDGRVIYTSFTEKVTNGKAILKQPLQTAVSLSTADFDHFVATERMHLIINVRDFKAIVTHADHLRASVAAYYSNPKRPLQFSYGSAQLGLLCEFTLMTHGDHQGADSSALPSPASSSTTANNTRPSLRAARAAAAAAAAGSSSNNGSRRIVADMPPPTAPASRTTATAAPTRPRKAPPGSASRPSQQQQDEDSANAEQSDSLFVPQQQRDAHDDEDEARWEPAYGDDEEEETLGWVASVDTNTFKTFQDSTAASSAAAARSGTIGTGSNGGDGAADGLAPTQRLSQIHGLW